MKEDQLTVITETFLSTIKRTKGNVHLEIKDNASMQGPVVQLRYFLSNDNFPDHDYDRKKK